MGNIGNVANNTFRFPERTVDENIALQMADV